jgi:hypothetical protein
MDELRKNKKLQRLGIDPAGAGRPAIRGRERMTVWDFIPLKQASKARNFTEYPHFTVSIQTLRVLVILTIPHRIRSEFRRNLVDLGSDGFGDLVLDIGADLEKLLRSARGAKPWMEVWQRHYPTQRSVPVVDAYLEFDLRTANPRRKKRSRKKQSVKPQPQWLAASYDAFVRKHSNLQLGVGALFPHSCEVLRSSKALDYFAGTRLACKPLLAAVLGRQFRQR